MLIFICFIVLFVFLKTSKQTFKKNIFLKSYLIFSFALFFITEILSLFKILNYRAITITWTLFLFTLVILILKNKSFVSNSISIKNSFLENLKSASKFQLLTLVSLFIIIMILFYQGLMYPPNNWDSLTYHMSRIMYWLGNESVNHFPTHILRHLYQPPFAEFFILHVNAVQGNDIFSNSVQLFFLVGILYIVNSLLKSYNVEKTIRFLTLLLIISIPTVLLQATTTKNDIVSTFFILSSLFFCLETIKRNQNENYIFLGLSIGLAMLTKSTAYVFLAPVLLIYAFAFMSQLIKNSDYKSFIRISYTISLILLINIGHFYRNYQIDNDILNVDKVEASFYPNEKMNAEFLASNFIKNTGLHLGYPVNLISDSLTTKMHAALLNVPINSPNTNYLNIPFEEKTITSTHEDLVSNTFHLLFSIISIITILLFSIKNFKNKKVLLILALIIALQLTLFCGYLKWQPWHTRLHIPMFVFSCILIGISANQMKFLKYSLIISLPLLLYSSFFYITNNNLRPFVENSEYTKSIKINDSRYKKYFSNQIHLYDEYRTIEKVLDQEKINSIGLQLSDWEYPILRNFYYDNIKVQAINVGNITSKIEQPNIEIDVIVTNSNNSKFIIFNDKTFYNKTPNNKNIWCYK